MRLITHGIIKLVYTLAITLTNQTVYVVSGAARNSLRGCKFNNFPVRGGGMPPDPLD